MRELDRIINADDIPLLSMQRITGNAHELDELKSEIAKRRATLADATDIMSAASAINNLEQQVSEFRLIPDSFDFAPTGQMLSEVWADDTNKARILRAIKSSMGLDLAPTLDDQPLIYIGTLPPETIKDGICDLGGGICFRLA
jgi:hypothetical protein